MTTVTAIPARTGPQGRRRAAQLLSTVASVLTAAMAMKSAW